MKNKPAKNKKHPLPPSRAGVLVVTPEQEDEIRRAYPKYFRLQKKLFPAKPTDPSEREILERIKAGMENVEKIRANLKSVMDERDALVAAHFSPLGYHAGISHAKP